MSVPNERGIIAYCEVAPEFEYRDGMFFVEARSGDFVSRSCFPPHAFLRALRGAQVAADAYFEERERGAGNVVPFRRHEPDH